MPALSIRSIIIRLSTRDIDEDRLIQKMRESVKKDPSVREKFKKYDVPLDKLDDVHIQFANLDVSAKTKDKKIYINRNLLSKGDDLTHYVVHEMVHFLQQFTGRTKGHNATDDYLHKSTEQEAYVVQIDFKEKNEGKKESKKYLNNLLDYHDKDGKERKELKEILD